MRTLVVILLCMFLSDKGWGQKHDYIWVSGKGYSNSLPDFKIDFNFNPPVVSVIDNKLVDNSPGQLEKIDSSRQLTEAYFETSRYLLFNNKKKQLNRK